MAAFLSDGDPAVSLETFPDLVSVESVFDALGLPLNELRAAFQEYSCGTTMTSGQGYQISLAADLEDHLERTLRRDGLKPSRSRSELTYSTSLNQRADFALVHEVSKRRILFEIEFRPNYEKDLVKFQIGYNSGILAAAVMVMAIDRKTINPRPPLYPSMPEYRSAITVLKELRPQYPLVVIGVLGCHTM
jgi:hypothetical protein